MSSGGTQVCSRCGEEKTLDAFSPDKRKPKGREHACKTCRASRLREKRESIPHINELSSERLYQSLDLRAAEDGVGGFCWRYIGSATKGTTPAYRAVFRLVNGWEPALGVGTETWCDNSWCCNPDHRILPSSLPKTSERDLRGDTPEDEQDESGWSALSKFDEPRSEAQYLRAMEEFPFEADDEDADRFLRENGYGKGGERLKNRA